MDKRKYIDRQISIYERDKLIERIADSSWWPAITVAAVLAFVCWNAFGATQDVWSVAGYKGTSKVKDYTGATSDAAYQACKLALKDLTTAGKPSCKTPVLTWTTVPDPVPPPVTLSNTTLTWQLVTQNTNGSPYTDPFGYVINYGNAPDQLTQSIDVNDPNATTYTVQGLAAGSWYFCVRARNTSNVRSDCSGIVSKTL